MRSRKIISALLLPTACAIAHAQGHAALPPFELLRKRMDVDVDGAPTAYGPRGKKTLDYLRSAHYQRNPHAEIVGYLTEEDNPNIPVVQGPSDPAPGYYISQTAFTDPTRTNERDVSRYVDASKINYVVLGDDARRRGARVGDFVAVHSGRTGRSVFAIVGDTGNPSGDEGSLHLLQDLGYPFHDGKRESVEQAEVVVRYYPKSNPHHEFFRAQTDLDAAALRHGLSIDFSAPAKKPAHPTASR